MEQERIDLTQFAARIEELRQQISQVIVGQSENIDLLLTGVPPDWQKRGVHSIYYAYMSGNAIKRNVRWAYSNPQIIGNEAQRIWDTTYKSSPLMKRAIFKKSI